MNGEVFFTGDLHLGHANIIKYSNRPFLCQRDKEFIQNNGGTWKGADRYRPSRDSVALMDEALLENINKTVPKDAILIELGDFAMPDRNHDYFERCKYYRNRINCRNMYHIFGNHDGAELGSIFNIFEAHGQKFYDCVPCAYINKIQFFLMHYAPLIWNKNHRGAIGLYGHSHSGAEDWSDQNLKGHRSMDVGVDNAFKILGEYRPFKMSEILKIMEDRKGFSIDHHELGE